MPKSPRQLDREINEALQHKRFAEAISARPFRKEPGTSATLQTPSRGHAGAKAKTGAALSRAKPKQPTRKSRVAHSTSKNGRNGAAREKIEELTSGTDPQEWSVARDLAIQKNIPDMIALLDMARALDVPPTDLEVSEVLGPYHNAFAVEHGDSWEGGQEYYVVFDEDTAYRMAIANVERDLELDPAATARLLEIEPKSFVERHQKKRKKGFDVDAAAIDLVNTKGWQHLVPRAAGYGGDAYTTDSGLVYWKWN